MYAKLNKCNFWLDKIVFLGQVISREGISIDPSKIEAVTDWPRPTKVGEVKSFLPLASYYKDLLRAFPR